MFSWLRSWNTGLLRSPLLFRPYRLDGIFRRHMDPGTLRKYSTWETLTLHDLGYKSFSCQPGVWFATRGLANVRVLRTDVSVFDQDVTVLHQ